MTAAMHTSTRNDHGISISTEIAGRREIWLTLTAVLLSVVILVAVAPFATRQLAHMPAFIPAYESALVISDLITAVLLFGQFKVLRSRALFVLASGYLFTAFIAFSHLLSFPDVFARSGLLGAGPQSTAWLFMFWHGGFPLFVIAYALLKSDARADPGISTVNNLRRGGSGVAIVAGVSAVLAIVCGLTFVATSNHDLLAVLVVNGRFTAENAAVVRILSILSLAALVVLWWRRKHTVLDLWLMVVMCAWLCDIALSAVFNATRYDLGWYAGRIYGLLAASSLLMVLLIENGMNYVRLAQLSDDLGAANKSLEHLSLHDELTGLPNRRFFDSYLGDQIAIARRHARALALVLFDVDSFKAYNDRYGHQAGDECLKQIAAALRSCCRRPADMAARFGGEEFALILPDTELSGAARIAEAVRETVGQLRIPHELSQVTSHISISGGIAVLLLKLDMTAQQLIAAADETLYRAKGGGRNRMVSVATMDG